MQDAPAAEEDAPQRVAPTCQVVHGPVRRGSSALAQAALLEVDDDEQDIPVVLAFGSAAGFTHVVSLLSIDRNVGADGTLSVQRLAIEDVDPGGSPEVLLEATQTLEGGPDAPPGPTLHITWKWWFLCGVADSTAAYCTRLLLASNRPSEAWEPLKHGAFELALTLKGGDFELRRVSGDVPEAYRRWLGTHPVRQLVAESSP